MDANPARFQAKKVNFSNEALLKDQKLETEKIATQMKAQFLAIQITHEHLKNKNYVYQKFIEKAPLPTRMPSINSQAWNVDLEYTAMATLLVYCEKLSEIETEKMMINKEQKHGFEKELSKNLKDNFEKLFLDQLIRMLDAKWILLISQKTF